MYIYINIYKYIYVYICIYIYIYLCMKERLTGLRSLLVFKRASQQIQNHENFI